MDSVDIVHVPILQPDNVYGLCPLSPWTFYRLDPWDGGLKACLNGPGHMTKTVAMPIYGKKH